ncbi:MAG TPA: response regulator [Candidatus Methylomirabilis sp.]|jgi:CheY-like chemotaxis protein
MAPARILVAEDDPALREALRDVLALAGYAAITVSDGTQALAAARAEPPDLIILDHLMPGLDGLSVLRALQADPRLRGIPVILLTGAAYDLSPQPGVAAIVDKPFQMVPLQDTVRSLLASRPAR